MDDRSDSWFHKYELDYEWKKQFWNHASVYWAIFDIVFKHVKEFGVESMVPFLYNKGCNLVVDHFQKSPVTGVGYSVGVVCPACNCSGSTVHHHVADIYFATAIQYDNHDLFEWKNELNQIMDYFAYVLEHSYHVPIIDFVNRYGREVQESFDLEREREREK